jgi:uncharacterized protein
MKVFKSIFKKNNSVLGMIHLQALPGTPKYNHDVNYILDSALKEVEIYKKAGIDGIIIENMHDVPYTKTEVGHEITSVMTLVGHEVKKLSNLPCGIQILAAANKASLAVAKAAGLDFIRAEGFVYGHLADEGYIDSDAAGLLRYRKMIDAEDIAVFTDIKKKHSSHAVTSDIDIVETALAAAYFLSDGVIITGSGTGKESQPEELEAVRYACKIPVIVGSGITIDNIEKYFPISDALIVGSHFKKGGYWANELDYEKTSRFMEAANKLRKTI